MCSEEQGQYISNIFLRPKPNNRVRMILDLNFFNDEFITYQHFKMHSLQTAIDLVTLGIFMTSIDLSDAYYSVSVRRDYRKFLRFRWEDRLMQFTCLPNGLACAPRLFTKLLNTVFAYFREKGCSAFQYIDDSIILHRDFHTCWDYTKFICDTLENLGFFVHRGKSVFSPSKQIIFLGFCIDSDSIPFRG